MSGTISILFDLFKTKLGSLLGSKICFSAALIDSRVEKTSTVRQNCRVHHSSIGRYSIVGRNSLIQSATIGHFCAISEGCNIGLPSHPTDMVSSCAVFLKGGNYLKKNFANFDWKDDLPTAIGSDVWIGAHAQVKSGLTIGHGAVVAAGAVVVKDVAPYSIVGGVPAKEIRKRFDDETIDRLLKSKWWEMDDAKIARYAHLFDNPSALLEALEGEKN